MIITMKMWHPIGSQVACKVVFRPMPSGRLCKASGDPLKEPSSEGPIECESFRVTCKHASCVCLGKCMVVTATTTTSSFPRSHPPYPPSPPHRPQCSADSLVYVQLSVISLSSTCRAFLTVVSVPRWTFRRRFSRSWVLSPVPRLLKALALQ